MIQSSHRPEGKSRFGGFFLLILAVGGCASSPPPAIRRHVSDMGAISINVQRIAGFTYVSSHSYLPGEREERYGDVAYFRCANGHRIGLRFVVGAENFHTARDIAYYACSAWQEVGRYFPSLDPIHTLRLTLVPEGVAFDDGSSHLGTRLEIDIAVRHYQSRPPLFFQRYLTRTLGHELFHAYVAFAGTGNEDEEFTAYLLESCVELAVVGSTHGDSTLLKSSLSLYDAASTNAEDELASSILGGLSARAAVEALGVDLPVNRSHGDARRLLQLCRDTID